jgi:hypothetical protein
MPACRTCNDSGIIRTAGGGCEPCPMCDAYDRIRADEPRSDWAAVAIYLAIAAIAVVGVGVAYGVIG